MPIFRWHLLVALGLALSVTASLIAPAAAVTTQPQLPHRTHAAPAHPARSHLSHAPSHAPGKTSHAKRSGPSRSHAASTHRHRRPHTPA